MEHFNKIQKAFITVSIILFLAINVVTAAIALPKIDFSSMAINNPFESSPPSSVIVYIKDLATNEIISQTDYSFGEEIKIANHTAIIQIQDNVLIANSPAVLTLKEDGTLDLLRGLYFFKLSDTLKLNIGKKQLEINKDVIPVYDADEKSLVVFSGSVLISSELEAKANNIIVWDETKYSVFPFLRFTLTSSDNWKALRDTLTKLEIIPEVLSDTTPPELSEILPIDGFSTEDESVTLHGQTESTAIVFINSNGVNLNTDGSFDIDVQLTLGENIFKIEASDEFGNISLLMISYDRTVDICKGNTKCGECGNAPCVLDSDDTSISCTYTSFNEQLLCLINKHRESNQLINLGFDASLSNAALAHSVWMDTNSTLSHIGENESNFDERCTNAGTVCFAENIAMNSSVSAENFFHMWKESSGHNENMLGNFNHIGIGLSGNYLTTVFK